MLVLVVLPLGSFLLLLSIYRPLTSRAAAAAAAATHTRARHQSIRLNDEIVLVRKALVVIGLSLVVALLASEFAGPL